MGRRGLLPLIRLSQEERGAGKEDEEEEEEEEESGRRMEVLGLDYGEFEIEVFFAFPKEEWRRKAVLQRGG